MGAMEQANIDSYTSMRSVGSGKLSSMLMPYVCTQLLKPLMQLMQGHHL